MNLKEKQYILKRITDIENNKKMEARNTCTIPAIHFTADEKIDRLIKGDYKIKDNKDYYWQNRIDFGEKHSVFENDKYTKIIQKIEHEATSLRDKVMLGNEGEEFLELLRKFSETVFE